MAGDNGDAQIALDSVDDLHGGQAHAAEEEGICTLQIHLAAVLIQEIFVSLAAQASCEREDDRIPFWRTLKKDGELNPKYPGGIEYQKDMLSKEGHTFFTKGRKNIRYFVENYENSMFDLK